MYLNSKMPFNLRDTILKRFALISGYVDLRQLHLDLAHIQASQPKLFNASLSPFLERLKQEYGNHIPLSEMQELLKIADSTLVDLDAQRQQIVDREPIPGAVVELNSIRLSVRAARAGYRGRHPERFLRGVDELLDSLALKYGNRVPIEYEHAIREYIGMK